MAKQIDVDGYVFDFGNAVVDAFVFDKPDRYKGVPSMKAVDIIAEFPGEYLFIELKRYRPHRGIEFRCPLWDDRELIGKRCPLANDDRRKGPASVRKITRDLRQKYCDTFLYCQANDLLKGKNVNYVCVVEGLDSALASRLRACVLKMLPKSKPASPVQWPRRIVKNVDVVNVDMWNRGKLARYAKCSLSPTQD